MKSQEVVALGGEPGHGRLAADTAVGSVPVVVVLPADQRLRPVFRVLVRPTAGQLAQGRLDETLSRRWSAADKFG